MKRKLLFLSVILLTALYSCQKENAVKTATGLEGKKITAKTSFVAQPAYYYHDLSLLPRQPGQNYDTYAGVWGSANIIVVGTPSWDAATYPNLVNGVPCTAAGIEAAPNQNAFASGDANVFVITEGYAGYFNSMKFQADVSKYRDAVDKYVRNPNTVPNPLIYEYIGQNYSTNPQVVTTTGKIIRVTTGSHFGIATVDYPLPGQTPQPISSTVIFLDDPERAGVSYELVLENANITHAYIGVPAVGGGIAYGPGPTTTVSVIGAYTHVYAQEDFHYYGDLYRLDGTSFHFDATGNSN